MKILSQVTWPPGRDSNLGPHKHETGVLIPLHLYSSFHKLQIKMHLYINHSASDDIYLFLYFLEHPVPLTL